VLLLLALSVLLSQASGGIHSVCSGIGTDRWIEGTTEEVPNHPWAVAVAVAVDFAVVLAMDFRANNEETIGNVRDDIGPNRNGWNE